MKPIQIQQSGATAGYLIISTIAVMAYTLATKDFTMLIFAIPVLLVFSLGATKDKGSTDQDLEAVGWSNKNSRLAIPLGIIGGLAALFFGSLVIQFTPKNTASLIPDFSTLGILSTASIITPTAALIMNIVAQIFIVSPSEESLSKVLAPFAGMSIFKNLALAYISGTVLWILMHIPSFIANGTPTSMYYVLAILGIVTAILYFITKNLLGSVIAHGTFNTGVLITAAGLSVVSIYVLGTLIAILSTAWLRGGKA